MVFSSQGGADSGAFDQAFRSKDVEGLVVLMDSNERIETKESMHQWAENPRTIGTLAATQLAILVSIPDPQDGNGRIISSRLNENQIYFQRTNYPY